MKLNQVNTPALEGVLPVLPILFFCKPLRPQALVSHQKGEEASGNFKFKYPASRESSFINCVMDVLK